MGESHMNRVLFVLLVVLVSFHPSAFAQQTDSKDAAYGEARQEYRAYLEELKRLSQQYKEVTGDMRKILKEEGVPVWDEEEGGVEVKSLPNPVSDAEVKETDTQMIVKIDLPGVKKNNVKVSIQDNKILHINAKREAAFERLVYLPVRASDKGPEAQLQDGVLTVTILKDPNAKKEVAVPIT